VEAVYSGNASFGASSGTTSLSVSAGSVHSAVVPILANPVQEMPSLSGYNWSCTIQLQNYGPVPTTLTEFTMGTPSTNSSGVTSTTVTDLTGSIAQVFGTVTIPAMSGSTPGTLTGVFGTNNITPPEMVMFSFTGIDPATLFAWNVQYTVSFNGPQPEVIMLVNGATLESFLIPGPVVSGPPDVAGLQQAVFAPGMMMSLLGPNGLPPTFNAGAVPGEGLPTSFTSSDGATSISATINGLAAPLYSATPSQINLQVPYELQNTLSTTATTSVAMLSLNNTGVTTSYSFTVSAVAPGVFVTNGIKNLSNGTFNSQTNPAPAGTMVTIFYTGAGVLASTVADGALDGPSDTPKSIATVMLVTNGTAPTPTLSFSPGLNNASVGMTPGMAGIAEATFTLPSTLEPGMYQVSIALQGVIGTTTQPSVTSDSVPLWVCNGNCIN
jgi:uncharacterized protein (TIGR03437 family)